MFGNPLDASWCWPAALPKGLAPNMLLADNAELLVLVVLAWPLVLYVLLGTSLLPASGLTGSVGEVTFSSSSSMRLTLLAPPLALNGLETKCD